MLYACNLRNGFGILNELTLCKSREKPVFGGRGGSARWVRVLLDFCRFCWLALCDGDATIWNIPRGDLDFVMNVILRTPNNVDRIRKTNIWEWRYTCPWGRAENANNVTYFTFLWKLTWIYLGHGFIIKDDNKDSKIGLLFRNEKWTRTARRFGFLSYSRLFKHRPIMLLITHLWINFHIM